MATPYINPHCAGRRQPTGEPPHPAFDVAGCFFAMASSLQKMLSLREVIGRDSIAALMALKYRVHTSIHVRTRW